MHTLNRSNWSILEYTMIVIAKKTWRILMVSFGDNRTYHGSRCMITIGNFPRQTKAFFNTVKSEFGGWHSTILRSCYGNNHQSLQYHWKTCKAASKLDPQKQPWRIPLAKRFGMNRPSFSKFVQINSCRQEHLTLVSCDSEVAGAFFTESDKQSLY